MKFEVKKREQKNISNYLSEDLEVARKYANIMYKELGDFISCLVLFGSAVKKPGASKRDLDILIVLDDVKVKFSREVVETYRIISEKAIADVDPERLHVQSMKLTSFWEYARSGDPVAINILRSGISLIDNNTFDPLQALLDDGRIRPSDESVWTYFTMASASLFKAEQHVLSAIVDLYWACIDSAHAALMNLGEIPPSPDHVADMLEKKLVAKGHVNKKYADIMRKLYTEFKRITHREIKDITGKQYDEYRKLATEFVDGMKKFIEKKK
ncbi:MAG: hypothetical protein V1815_00490 [Candidatus Woesearchaeota archaeon]